MAGRERDVSTMSFAPALLAACVLDTLRAHAALSREGVLVCLLHELCATEAAFLAKALTTDGVKDALASVGMFLDLAAGDETTLVFSDATRPLSSAEALTAAFLAACDALVAADAATTFHGPFSLRFHALTTWIVAGIVDLLTEYLPYVDLRPVAAAAVVPITPSGEEFMVPYELSWEANSAGGTVAFPDPDKLTPAHITALCGLYGSLSPAHFRLQFLMACFHIPCHEVVHLVQGAAGQTDSNPYSFSAEHDASRVNFSILWQLLQVCACCDALCVCALSLAST